MQYPVWISSTDTVDSLSEKILSEESKILSESIRLYCEGKIKFIRKKIKIIGKFTFAEISSLSPYCESDNISATHRG